ncbi:MAG: carboxypeptidase-like regulatory domain-containing protein [Chlorobi bacterium]|nr:carboxypeptidase-like regulatory domain-containing protein [Chlorobiota bacterium]
MIKKILLTSGIIVFTWMSMFSQEATLQGKIIDKKTKEPIAFANIVVLW